MAGTFASGSAEWTPLDELTALFAAERPDDLHRALILTPPAGGDAADAFIPVWLLRRVHGNEPEDAATTALLLVTDRRWGLQPCASSAGSPTRASSPMTNSTCSPTRSWPQDGTSTGSHRLTGST